MSTFAVCQHHSTGAGGVVRYIGRHGTNRMAKAVLLGAIPSVIVKSAANPGHSLVFAYVDVMQTENVCAHLGAIESIKHPKRQECEDCVKVGSDWVHLRTCQQCGATLCCDSSPNRHASRHASASGHPVIASAQPGERWLYCYSDEEMAAY